MSKVLILANDYTTIYNFRRELVARLLEEKHSVIISLPANDNNKVFMEMGCEIAESILSRFGKNPIKELLLLISYIRLIKKIHPDVVLTYTAKPNIYGSLACQLCKVPYINNVTGLGKIFQTESLIKETMLLLQKAAFRKSQCVFFQNISNMNFYEAKGIVRNNAKLLPGSGVNLQLHRFEPYPDDCNMLRFITVSRLRKDKGFEELFEAIKEVTKKFDKIEFHIVGWYEDDEYKSKIHYMTENYPVVYHGKRSQEEVHKLIAESHCIIHPSHHEGMANVLLEAAAAGRPCIASDIPGCREAIEDKKTGFLFKVGSSESLKNAIIKFILLNYESRLLMGIDGNKKITAEFDRQIVIAAYMNEIENVTIGGNADVII